MTEESIPKKTRPARILSALRGFPFSVPVSEMLLLFLLCWGSIGGIVSGFDLPVRQGVFVSGLCGMAVLLTVLSLFPKRRSLIGAGLLFCLVLWGFLQRETLWIGLRYEMLGVFRYLMLGFPSSVKLPGFLVEFSVSEVFVGEEQLSVSELAGAGTAALLFLSAVLAFCFWVLYLSEHQAIAAALLPIPAFVLCFLIIDSTMPDAFSLVCVLLYWLLLLLSAKIVRMSFADAGKQLLLCVLPCLLLFFAVWLIFPRESYERGSFRVMADRIGEKIQDAALSVWDKAEELVSPKMQPSTLPWVTSAEVEGEKIELSELGKRRYAGSAVMTAESDKKGVMYLRENTFSSYSGKEWTESDSRAERYPDDHVLTYGADRIAEAGGTVYSVRLSGARSERIFMPYFYGGTTAETEAEGDRAVLNKGRKQNYTVRFYPLPASGIPEGKDAFYASYPEAVRSDKELCEVPAESMGTLKRIVQKEKLKSDGLWETVDRVTAYVRGSAAYSLDPVKMPAGEDDFASWFLENAESGYCVHFATAEVLLLRACGYPSRLAVGYLIRIGEGKTEVLDSDAHAWAEVFDDRLGWIPVEATPTAESDTAAEGAVEPAGLEDAEKYASVIQDPEFSAKEPPTTEEPQKGTEPGKDTEKQTEPKDTETEPADTEPTDTEPDEPDGTETTDEESRSSGGKKDPDGSGSGKKDPGKTPEDDKTPFRFPWKALGILFGIAALVSVLPVNRKLRMYLRKKEEEKESDPNRRALILYVRCQKTARKLGKPLPAALTRLAEKAKFSRHTVSSDELSEFSAWYNDAVETIRKTDNPLNRFRHYWIEALY